MKKFDGDPNNYDIWEDFFMATLCIMKLYVAFDKYSDHLISDFNVSKARKTFKIYVKKAGEGKKEREVKNKSKDRVVAVGFVSQVSC